MTAVFEFLSFSVMKRGLVFLTQWLTKINWMRLLVVTRSMDKIMYPKYTKLWLSTIDCVCSKILNHGLNYGFIIFTFQVIWVKKHSELIENSGLKSRFFTLFNISVLLDVQANLPESSPFFVCPNGIGEHLFQMFIVHTWDV